MSIVMQINPFDIFLDLAGDALDEGYVWIGQPNKDPRSYPVPVFLDAALTMPMAQPMRTNAGYIVRGNAPTFLYISGNYSVLVQDKTGRQVYYISDFLLIGNSAAASLADVAKVVADLANAVDPLKGAASIGRAMQGASTVVELKTLSTSGPSRYAELFGYYAKGDGGGGLYYVPDSFVGLVEGPTVVLANDGGFWCLNHNGIVSIRQAGAKSDGTDTTAKIQPLLDFSGVKRVNVDPGIFRVTNLKISRAMTFSGAGAVSVIQSTSSTDDSIEVASGLTSMTGVVVENMTIDSLVTKISGFGLRQSASDGGAMYLSHFRNIDISGGHKSGVAIESTVWCTLDSITVKKIGVAGIGLLFRGSAGGKSASNCMVSKFRVLEGSSGADSVGLWIDSYSEGNYFSQCTFESPSIEIGVRISDTLASSDSVKNHFFDQLICDANAISGLRIDAGRTLNFTNGWFNTCQLGDGANLAGCFDVNFTQCEFANNWHSGVLIQETASDVTFTSCLLPGNSIQGVNLYSGALINFNTNDIKFIGCAFARRRGTSSNHKYSVEFKGGSSQGYMVVNCQLRGFNTASILDGGVTTNKVITNNLVA